VAEVTEGVDPTDRPNRSSFVRIDLTRTERRRYSVFGALGIVAGLLVALVYTLVIPPVYEATVFADFERLAPDTTSGIYASIDTVSSEANSTETFRAVIDDLDLDLSVDELRSMVVVKPLFGNPSIRVTATAGNSEQAESIALAFVSVMEELPTPLDVTEKVANYRVDLRNPIELPLRPTTPKPSHDLVTGAFLGLGIGLIAARTVRRQPSPSSEEASHGR
jgi:capsular polysaccharide biosynthesis protein